MFRTCHFPGLEWLDFLTKPEICEFEVSFFADQDIIRLDISMNIVHPMHFLDGNDELTDIESGLCLCKDVLLDEKTKKISSWDPLHCNIEIFFILKGRFQLNKPSASVSGQAFSFQEYACHLFLPC